MQPSTEPVCVVIKRGEAYPGKRDLDYFTGVSAETAGSKRLCMHLVAIPPRGRAKPHLHAHHESVTYMLSGEAGQRVRPTSGQALDHRYPLASCWLAWQWCLLAISSVWATSPPDQPASERGLARPRRRVRRSAPRYWHCTGWLLRACLQRPRGPPHSALIYSNRRRLHGNDRPPRTPIRTAAALVRMRAAVLRHHHQLRRSPSARAAQARARKGTRLARGGLRLDRLRVPTGLCADDALRRPPDRLGGHAPGLCGGRSAVERGGHGARAGAQCGGLRSGALRSRAERVPGLPSRPPHGGGLVPATPARSGHRHRQQRREYRRHSRPFGGPLSGAALRVALGVHCDRRGRPGLGAALVVVPSRTARSAAPAFGGRGTRAPPPLGSLLTSRPAWAFILGKFLTDPAWVFYLFWLPGFLNRVYGLDLAHLGLPIIVVYQASAVGSIGGGWISTALLKRGWTPNRAREAAMLICAVAVTPVIFVDTARANMWLVVALVGVATAAHQGWSANLYTMASDLFPRGAVGSVVGLGGLGGAVGGMLVAPMVGYWLDWSHGAYAPLFVVAGCIYLVALAIIHWLSPRYLSALE